jgi:hypothetical protein
VLDHRRQCADWVADYARERHGLERFTYDVHLLDGEVDRPDVEGVDNLRPHWKGVARYLTDRVPYPREADGGSAVWQYRPFQLEDTQLTGTPDPSEVDRSSVEYLTRLVEELRASRYPVRFQYATATLLGEKNGDINAARVTFTYPTIAKFQRTNSPEEATYNAEGDRIQQRTEISSRTYRAPVSPELQQALDLAREQTRLATAKAIETWGDEDYFITADDGTTNYNNEALLAPIHNSI